MAGWLLLLFFVAIGMSLLVVGLRRRAELLVDDDPPPERPRPSSQVARPPPALPQSDPTPPVSTRSTRSVTASTTTTSIWSQQKSTHVVTRSHVSFISERGVSPPPLPPELAWLRQLLFALHGLIVGGSGTGKTTLAHFVATSRAKLGHRVIVADPDARPGMWPGCEVVGSGNDFSAIEARLQAVQRDIDLRHELRAHGRQTFKPLTLVLSDAAIVIAECPTAQVLLEQGLRRWRKLNAGLLVDVQDDQVGTLGLQGKGKVRQNFSMRVELRVTGTGERLVRVDDAEYAMPDLPDPEALADAHVESPPERWVQPEQATLAALLATTPDDLPAPNGVTPEQSLRSVRRTMLQRVTTQAQAAEILSPTIAELRRLARAISLWEQSGRKQKLVAIETAFEVKRGESVRWERAYQLFEIATDAPPPTSDIPSREQ